MPPRTLTAASGFVVFILSYHKRIQDLAFGHRLAIKFVEALCPQIDSEGDTRKQHEGIWAFLPKLFETDTPSTIRFVFQALRITVRVALLVGLQVLRLALLPYQTWLRAIMFNPDRRD